MKTVRLTSYSPSGIAYVNNPGTDSEIWTIQPGGGGRQQVTDNGLTTAILTGAVNSDCSLRVAPEE